MLSLGALTFAAPWALAALAALPALWWLLKATPPSPRRVIFPPLRLLAMLASREESAVRTPWWLLALRLVLVAALIFGIARPLLNAETSLSGFGPVYIVFDNGWASGEDWSKRTAQLSRTIDRADREQRGIVLVLTAATASEQKLSRPVLLPAARAREAAQTLVPSPWPTDRLQAVTSLLRAANEARWPPGTVVWISDGLAEPHGAEPAAALLDRLRALGQPTVVTPPPQRLPLVIAPPQRGADALYAGVSRAEGEGERPVVLRLIGQDGEPLAKQAGRFVAGERSVRLPLDMPTELAGRLARVEIEAADTAGAVWLVDERWQRRAVGLLDEGSNREQPLLGGHYYVQRALQPFAEVRHGDLATLLARPLSVLVLTDVGTPDPASVESIRRWVEQGGVLLRFAGERLARDARVDDPLLPTPLRAGDRTIGGALSWTGAGKLAEFDEDSPLNGLPVPPDVAIRRQVVAEPSLDAAERTWARLEDGTPLITGTRRGAGWVVLVHTTADPEWSNLPLSGMFVDILRRVVGLAAGGVAGKEGSSLPPLEVLDGFGKLGAPLAGTRALAGEELPSVRVAPGNPPGFYGSPDARRALNLAPTVGVPAALGPLPASVRSVTLGVSNEIDLQPWLLMIALALGVVDLAVSLAMRGMFRPRRRRSLGRAAAGVLLLAFSVLPFAGARAQSVVADGSAVSAALSTRLAWVRSGDPRIDQISAAGLRSLGAVVNRRTAAELDNPVGIDPEIDDLSFYPFLYWPLTDQLRPLSPAAVRRLSDFMRGGGTIVFDLPARLDGAERAGLRDMARMLDLPPLIPVPEDHVLRRSYYLLSDLPGRRAGAPVWIERLGEHVNDGVSSVVAGSNDWAAAWATDEDQRPLFPVGPGGERQRELAYRFGVNLVMYVLTGNYKADQVHLSTILERLAP
jgi:hypothetical protein